MAKSSRSESAGRVIRSAILDGKIWNDESPEADQNQPEPLFVLRLDGRHKGDWLDSNFFSSTTHCVSANCVLARQAGKTMPQSAPTKNPAPASRNTEKKATIQPSGSWVDLLAFLA